ncbi:hypothetical protein MKW92_004863 [Papaver armeniacum]|nr:hypothetical protein MKW92_004863 [Papaver armeniacum]
MPTMSIIQPHRIGCGDHITTDTTTAVMGKKKRAYKRRDCGGDTDTKKRKDCGGDPTYTPTATQTKKRACRSRDCGGDTTNTPTATETNKRKDCGGDTRNTSTVTETKKRACRRRDCGVDATNTSTVTETKKRKDCADTDTSTAMEAKKVKDCGGDTNASAVMEKKKRAYRRKDCVTGTNTPAVVEKKKRPYRRKKGLPHDLILEEILTKLPVPALLKSVLVSKLWYNCIHTDHKRLTYSHFLESQRQPQVVLSLLNVREVFKTNTGIPTYGCHFFKFAGTSSDYCFNNVLRFDKFRNHLGHPNVWEMVGYCNGLPCMSHAGNYSSGYVVLDPNRRDFMCIFYPASVGIYTQEAEIICHGFGFDPRRTSTRW